MQRRSGLLELALASGRLGVEAIPRVWEEGNSQVADSADSRAAGGDAAGDRVVAQRVVVRYVVLGHVADDRVEVVGGCRVDSQQEEGLGMLENLAVNPVAGQGVACHSESKALRARSMADLLVAVLSPVSTLAQAKEALLRRHWCFHVLACAEAWGSGRVPFWPSWPSCGPPSPFPSPSPFLSSSSSLHVTAIASAIATRS